MLYYLLVSVPLLVLIWVYLQWVYMRNYYRKKGVPYVPPHPIFGSFTFLQRKNPAVWMTEIYNKYKAPYVGIWVFWRPGLVVNCPELGQRILIKDAELFKNRFVSSGKRDPIGSLNLFTLNDPLWSSIRKRLTPMFTAAKLRALQPLYSGKAQELVQRVKADIQKGIKIDLRTTYSDYTTDVIGESAFGIKCNATLTGTGPLRITTKDFMKYNVWRGLSWCSIFFLPELVDIFGFTFFPKHSVAYFKKTFRKIVEERGGYDNKNFETTDLLTALVKMKQDAAKDNEEMSEDLLVAQATVFLQGGYDTSSITLMYATYELAFHPDYQERLYEELSETKAKLGNKEFDSAILADLTYLNCVFNETLRKYPVLGWLDRLADKDYKIDDNLTITAGTVVYVNVVGMQLDPEFYPDPLTFNPDRFLPENKGNIPANTFMPFGEGPRHCVGELFGKNTVRYALANIILNYKMKPWPNSKKPNDVGLEKKGLFLMPDQVMSVEFVPRK